MSNNYIKSQIIEIMKIKISLASIHLDILKNITGSELL